MTAPDTVPHSALARDGLRQAARSTALALAAFAGGLLLLESLRHGPVGAWRGVDMGCGAASCVALFWRRRAPVAVAVLLGAVAAVVACAGVANMVALYVVARHRGLRVALAVAFADVVAGWMFSLVYPGNVGLFETLTVNVGIAAAATAWGALRQSQQALLDAYRERAERAEREQRMREEQIRATERARIAREMHDVIASRVSLIALHAGGLEVAPEHGRDDVRATAQLIRTSAVRALEELRCAIGVLRSGEPRSLDQPGLEGLDDLVQEARRAGQDVDFTAQEAINPTAAPAAGRDLYRIVQEGLTNARKHAPGQPVQITLSRSENDVQILMRNPCTARSLGVPGSSSGLIGLRERAALAGGTLTHALTPGGNFELAARLPWR